MIYLIGWSPKCGKTTLAKALSQNLWIPWVSTDTLQCVIKPYINEASLDKKSPTSSQKCKNNDEKYSKYSSKEIIDAYRCQARTVFSAIDMFAICEITDGNDFIIEWYHIEPQLAKELSEKYPNKTKALFLSKTDKQKFIQDIQKSTTPNDWIIENTHKDQTFLKIAHMISEYWDIFQGEAKKYNFQYISMDESFEDKIQEWIEFFAKL